MDQHPPQNQNAHQQQKRQLQTSAAKQTTPAVRANADTNSDATTITDDTDNDDNIYAPTTTSGANDAPFVDESWLLKSAAARHELAKYLFAELYQRNFTDSFDNSSVIVASATNAIASSSSTSPASSESVQLGGSGAGVLAADIAQSNASRADFGTSSDVGIGFAQFGSRTGTGTGAGGGADTAQRDNLYFGELFRSLYTAAWPVHCVVCLVICTVGIFANVTNVVVLSRPNMITAVNTILSAIALADLIVNILNIPFLVHELDDKHNIAAFYSYPWAVYYILYAHVTVTAHTISIWLTCVLATWRYFVVCRSNNSDKRNWSVGLASRAVVGVIVFVPVFCIPNYLSFAIVKDPLENGQVLYKTGFSKFAEKSQFIRAFHFGVFSCLTKLVPCVLLTYFTTVLIRKLLEARERRMRLANFGAQRPSGDQLAELSKSPSILRLAKAHANHDRRSQSAIGGGPPDAPTCGGGSGERSGGVGPEGHTSSLTNTAAKQLMVESCPSSSRGVTTTAASTCGAIEATNNGASTCNKGSSSTNIAAGASTGALSASGADFGQRAGSQTTLASESTANGGAKRLSETDIGVAGGAGRSIGSTSAVYIGGAQLAKLQATQRQIAQNETTTQLLIAVMIVFLICETPAGILAGLCAILGQDFVENVYEPCGFIMDFLALFNSSVNFMIYCFMSTQFRCTFYQVVLRCPAPNLPNLPPQTAQTPHSTKLNSSNNQNKTNSANKNTNNYCAPRLVTDATARGQIAIAQAKK